MIRALLRAAQHLVRETSQPLTWVLGYHLVRGGTGLSIDTPRAQFLDQLRLLSDNAAIVPLSELTRRLGDGTAAAPQTQVVLTFDDAFLNFYEEVLPLLVENSLPATLFVPPGFINGDGNHPLYHPRFSHLRPMTWEQVRECAKAGVEIGSHTYRHTNLTRLTAAELTQELSGSRQDIEEHLGVRPACVCYPEGFVNRSVVRAAAQSFECGVVGGGRAIRAAHGEDMMKLPRLPVRADMSAEDLSRVLNQSVYLEEWAADKVRRLRGRVAKRD